MSFPSNPVQPVSNDIVKTQSAQTQANLAQTAAVQESMQKSAETYLDQFAVNTMQIIRRNSEPLEDRIKKRVSSHTPQKSETEEEEELPLTIEATGEVSEYYENKNPELKAKSLQSLKDAISKNDTSEDILQKVLENYPDPVMADSAFEYLLTVMSDDLKEKILNARQTFSERFAKKLKAGKNIFEESLKFAEEGLGAPSELRQAYNELTSEPRSTLDIFEDLLSKFTYDKMKQAIKFWLSALGADLNSKGSSIEKGELYKLIDETKTLLAILGVYNYFASKQKELVTTLMKKNTVATIEMTFQNLAKLFVKILQDPYPSPDKILFLKYDLKIESHLLSQEAVFNIMCSAVKNVAPKLFRNTKHKEEILSCFFVALEAIDSVLGDEK